MLDIEKLEEQLFEMQDLKYRDFHSKLLPGIDKETLIGIRTPMLRKFAKEFAKTPEAEEFLQVLPHRYYEENNMHMMIVTCDLPAPKCFAKHREELLPEIRSWIASGETYTIRYGIGLLMSFYLDEAFEPEYLELAAGVRSEEYYVNMMRAWYFATALAKQYDQIIPYLEEQRLDTWTHNKTIQKAIESYRITPEQKSY